MQKVVFQDSQRPTLCQDVFVFKRQGLLLTVLQSELQSDIITFLAVLETGWVLSQGGQ